MDEIRLAFYLTWPMWAFLALLAVAAVVGEVVLK